MNNTKQWKHSLILLITASIWGFAFVAQSIATDYIGTFTFNSIRFFMGSIVLLPYIIVSQKKQGKKKRYSNCKKETKSNVWKAGLICGSILCVSSCLQQIGIGYTAVGKAGFITAIYILIVPILGIFFHKKIEKKIIACVVIALIGLYLLCIKENVFLIQKMDWILLLSAFGFALHILAIDHFGDIIESIQLACVQFFVAGAISFAGMIFFEKPELHYILAAAKPLIYAGVFSSGIAYTLQIVGQKELNPTVASLIMSLESVISVLAGWLILHQNLSKRELIGCALVFFAILLAQIPLPLKNSIVQEESVYEKNAKTGF